ncbi:MAG: bifunctional hydroxymethylpyrimidine kinase/phosphomethylpyrimidine kinase [Litoreibacter sp.]
MQKRTPIALTIAGSDSGGGAGIQADLKTFAALGVYGASAITAVTAQNTTSVTAVHPVPANIVAAQIQAVLSDLNVAAIKLGMLFSPEIISATALAIAGHTAPVVLDPAMISKSGDALLQSIAIATLKKRLFPVATLLTPNLPEAAALTGTPQARTQSEMIAQAENLLQSGANAILIKGGHGNQEHCVDLLVQRDKEAVVFSAPRRYTKNTHGTGCTLSSAIASGLAKKVPLEEAVSDAHIYLHAALNAADTLEIGHGHGPVHHGHAQWQTA